MEWKYEPLAIYLDTSAWIRPFENRGGLESMENGAINRILKNHVSKKLLVIIGSKFQYGQLVDLQTSAKMPEDAYKYEQSVLLHSLYCPNLIKPSKHHESMASELMKKTGMVYGDGPSEDAVHIATAWLSGATHFITTDMGLFRTKKETIEQALREMEPSYGCNCKDMTILNPIDFEQMLERKAGGV